MIERIQNSWQLVKASFNVLKADRELMLFPLLSMLGVIVLMILFSVPLMLTGILDALANEQVTTPQAILGFVIMFLFYFSTYTVIIYSNVALVGAALLRLRGEDPTVRDGFRIASSKLNKIFGYAAIAATVGMLLNSLRNEDNILSQLLGSILAFAWNVVTFLVIPVLVVEDVGPIDAIKRSGSLLRQTWGEQLTANFGIGAVIGLATIGVIFLIGGPLIALASAANSGGLIVAAVVVVVLLVVLLSLFGAALSSIYQAALYNYATQGTAGDLFDDYLIAGAFKPKRGERAL